MQWLWTWGGECFGYRDGDNLWTGSGLHVGRFHGEEVFGPDGGYLGELKGASGNRLITKLAKQSRRQPAFTPCASKAGYASNADYAGYAIYVGYEDFPSPDVFQ